MAHVRSTGGPILMIPCANPRAQYLAHKDEIDSAIHCVLDSGRYILDSQVECFEREFATWIGTSHCIGVGSATEALHISLAACGVRPGDEVITVANTAVATVAAIHLAGANPVFVDIEPKSFTMNPDLIENSLSTRTKVILPVHLYGHPADMEAICEIAKENGLRVIEDCAQAHGAAIGDRKAGTLGDVSCFSFYPTKNLGALGDGGAVVTNNEQIAEKVMLLREYGWQERFISHTKGWNTRLDEIQAAILRVKLPFLDSDNAARRRIALDYRSALAESGLVLPAEQDATTHAYHLYVVRSLCRDSLLGKLKKQGVGAAIHYPVPIHKQPAYAKHGVELPETERAAEEIISLPIYPELPVKDAETVVRAVVATL